MPSIARFVRLDLRALRPQAKRTLLPALIFVAAATWQLRSADGALLAAAMLALVAVPTFLFGADERGRLDTLYAVLAFSRRRVVAGRYASALLLLVGVNVAALVVTPLVATVARTPLHWTPTLLLAAGAVGVVGVILALEMPVYFAVGSARARLTAIVVPAVFVLIGAGVTAWLVPTSGRRVLAWVAGAGAGWLALAAIVALFVVGVPSYAIAARLYARRDL